MTDMGKVKAEVLARFDGSMAVYRHVSDELAALAQREPLLSPEIEFCRDLIARLGARIATLEFDRQQWSRVGNDYGLTSAEKAE